MCFTWYHWVVDNLLLIIMIQKTTILSDYSNRFGDSISWSQDIISKHHDLTFIHTINRSNYDLDHNRWYWSSKPPFLLWKMLFNHPTTMLALLGSFLAGLYVYGQYDLNFYVCIVLKVIPIFILAHQCFQAAAVVGTIVIITSSCTYMCFVSPLLLDLW